VEHLNISSGKTVIKYTLVFIAKKQGEKHRVRSPKNTLKPAPGKHLIFLPKIRIIKNTAPLCRKEHDNHVHAPKRAKQHTQSSTCTLVFIAKKQGEKHRVRSPKNTLNPAPGKHLIFLPKNQKHKKIAPLCRKQHDNHVHAPKRAKQHTQLSTCTLVFIAKKQGEKHRVRSPKNTLKPAPGKHLIFLPKNQKHKKSNAHYAQNTYQPPQALTIKKDDLVHWACRFIENARISQGDATDRLTNTHNY